MGSWWNLPVLVFVIFLKCVKTLAWKIWPGTQMIAYFCYIKILRLILIAIPGGNHRIHIVFFLERLSSSFFFWYITKLGTPAQKTGFILYTYFYIQFENADSSRALLPFLLFKMKKKIYVEILWVYVVKIDSETFQWFNLANFKSVGYKFHDPQDT